MGVSVTREQRAEELMRRGPIQNVRRIMELEDAIAQARRDLWWFVERDTGDGWGFTESDADEIAARAMEIQDKVLDSMFQQPLTS